MHPFPGGSVRYTATMPTSISDVLYHGIAFDLKNWDKPIVPREIAAAGEEFLDALDARGIDYTLVGGLALLSYVDGRNTQDIDLIATVSELQTVDGFEVRETNEWFAQGDYRGLRVDILRQERPLFRLVARDWSVVRPFGARPVKMASAEGLTLLKLFALPSLYRQFQMGKALIYETDIALLMDSQKPDTAKLLDLLSHHVSEGDIAELRKTILELHEKLGRAGKYGAPPI